MAGNLITSLLSLATNLLPSITASAQAPSSSSPNSNHNYGKNCARAVVEDLESLMRTLERIKATLYDAEVREIRDRSVKLWLKELKKVAYDAEDVLSEYRYEVTRVQVDARKDSQTSGSHKRKQTEHIVPVPDSMACRLSKVRSRFDEIGKDRDVLHLRKSDGVVHLSNKIQQTPTSHMMDESSIFGRDAEKMELIDLLLSEKDKSFSVISIVGKGGIGKTTIAQLVYKDLRDSQWFDLFGWVCVSEEFDVRRLIIATIESVSKINNDVSEWSRLQEELAKTVKGKTILLVLDDVWNENQSLWELFRNPFKEAKMVRILVTTRHQKVAEVMQAVACFRPSNLPEDSCWQLFQHYAFSATSGILPTHLVDTGREIMKKCGGLPLAVKSIASLLRHETNEESWREILESDLWESNSSNDVFRALQISYAHLPPHLKWCFLFCSMYPKDYILKKMNLIELWISHGYIEPRGKRGIIEIGVEYYEELKKRSFLDDFSEYSDRASECCKLHDIIHDFARLNSENEHYSVEINQPLDMQEVNVPQEVYHLYAGGFMGYVNQFLQQNMKGLRTLCMDLRHCDGDLEHQYCLNNVKEMELDFKQSEYYEGCSGDVTICNLTKFEALRVLEVNSDNLTMISHSISKLKHLVYLGITSARLKMLPLSIGLLYNLQTLVLNCNFLEYLPESIGDLVNLQFLYVQSYIVKKLPQSFCSLSNLLRLVIISIKSLDYFPHGFINFPIIKTMKAGLRVRTIAWLEDMKDLEGKLCIEGLKNMSNLVDAQRANLRNKSKLESLDLCWDPKIYSSSQSTSELILSLIPEACESRSVDEDDADFSLLECLQPHPNLKKLRVRRYRSATIPRWMRDPFSLQSIQEVLLQKCDKIQSLPFQKLHSLKHLTIDACSSIRVIQLEQLPTKIQELQISYCDHLELITGIGDLDMLASLKIKYCQALKSLTRNRLQLVESTELFGDSYEKPRICQQSISTLKMLLIEYCDSLHVLPDWLIPSGRRYVCVHGCGCPEIFKVSLIQ